MKTLILCAALLLSLAAGASAQHEYAPLVEKEVKYKNWSYKRLDGGKEINLREAVAGKKLALVVYFAPWCPNWKLQAPFAQKMYDQYRASGLEVIGVGEYAGLDQMKTSVETYKITFPVVYESDSTAAKQTTAHYEYRRATGDTRNWGSPWSIFLVPAELKKQGDVLTEKTFVVNGELIEAEAEAFIRQKLGLSKDEKKAATAQKAATEVCDPATATNFAKP
jgi:peroxiredoxin